MPPIQTAHMAVGALVVVSLVNCLGAWLVIWALGVAWLRIRHRHTWLNRLRWALRALPVGIFYGAYSALLAAYNGLPDTGRPLADSRHVIGLERALHVWVEPTVSHWTVPGAWGWYDVMHLGVTLPLLVWIGTSREDLWPWARNALGITTGVSLASWYLFPMDPPRLLPLHYGIAQHASLGGLNNLAAAYAVVPSLHTAWAAWVAVVAWRVLPGRWKALGPAYAAVTAFVVMVTGNHYVTDVVAGEALACLSSVVARVLAAQPFPRLRWGRLSVTGWSPNLRRQLEAS